MGALVNLLSLVLSLILFMLVTLVPSAFNYWLAKRKSRDPNLGLTGANDQRRQHSCNHCGVGLYKTGF